MPRTSSPKAMFSADLISGKSARFWKISAVGRLFGPMPLMSLPPIRMTPSVGSMKPEIMRRIVVLPQPDGPRKLKNSPARDGQMHVGDSGQCAEAHGDVVQFDVLAHETSWKGRHPS